MSKMRFFLLFVIFLFIVKAGGLAPAIISSAPLYLAGQKVELSLTPISEQAIRITFLPFNAQGKLEPITDSTVLVPRDWPPPAFRITSLEAERIISLKTLRIRIIPSPLSVEIQDAGGNIIQKLVFNQKTGAMAFRIGNSPILGLGGGGKQFDRQGAFDPMTNGHRAGEYQIFGSRVPVPFLIGTEGWAIFVHRPYNGTFDLREKQGLFQAKAESREEKEQPLPLDIFVINSHAPSVIMSEYANLTGHPVLPPKWALGYFQSHRTISGPEEVLSVAESFRHKQLPCDGLIYLGTGYCPQGWNLGHGSLEFNPKSFDQPQEIINRLHELNFKVILHVNRAPKTLHGNFPPLAGEKTGADHIANYWDRHRNVFSLRIDGWWPDNGDELPIDSRLARHLIYYQGPLSERPNERPFSLHRTGYAGIQRYGGWVWSGDVFSLWETLAAHVPIGLNFSLSVSPFWGTDIGGFTPTRELTGELYVRWFQFMSFCPLFRSHGRVWHTRLPWGWNTGELGPFEINPETKGTAPPDSNELHNPEVEPICRQYLNLRYQLIPYIYTHIREAYDTGMPVMRALWLHYPDDLKAQSCGDEYLWGRDILVAPIVKKGASKSLIYLPKGKWYDFWAKVAVAGNQEISRYVDLSTLPLYVRAGAIIPFGPAIQYVDQPSEQPITLNVYRGESGEFVLYEDDDHSLDYQKNKALWTKFSWDDALKKLTIEPDKRSVLKQTGQRTFEVLLIPEGIRQSIKYSGERIEVKF